MYVYIFMFIYICVLVDISSLIFLILHSCSNGDASWALHYRKTLTREEAFAFTKLEEHPLSLAFQMHIILELLYQLRL